MTSSLCLVTYCPQGHRNVLALITDALLFQPSGAKLWKLTCKTCLKSLEVPEYDLKTEHIVDTDLDHEYGRHTLPTLP